MQTFAELSAYVRKHYQVVLEEKFLIGLEVPIGPGERHQTVFLAELKDTDDSRVLRIETTIAPLANHDPEKALRVNQVLRKGYLAVGDMEGVPFLKLCENLAYAFLSTPMLDHSIQHVALLGDRMEETLTDGNDFF